jgi:hypothetical protein
VARKFITQIKIYIGGKDATNIQCDLSKKHLVKDVIKHVLTLYRKNKCLKIFECPSDQPQCFDLRQIDDDSDNSENSDGENTVYYKPLWELPALDLNQQIGGYESLVLIQKKNWKNLLKNTQKKELEFIK